MSIKGTQETLVVTPEERTWRATIESPRGGDYTLSIHRESRLVDDSGNVQGAVTTLPTIVVSFATAKDETITVAGKTYTVGELAAVLSAYFDQKATETKQPVEVPELAPDSVLIPVSAE